MVYHRCRRSGFGPRGYRRLRRFCEANINRLFTPHFNSGDFVVVINAEKIAVTGNRLDQKIYYRHWQYPGGLKKQTLRQMLDGKFPERAIEHAVRGMVMHNRLGAEIMKRLKIYAGPTHPHQAQQPVVWTGPEALLKQEYTEAKLKKRRTYVG